ncbi:spindle pole body component 110-like isoform X2 [Cimex lectularius]|nr:spindle pole body component 110-like isoform X2 [Cimex lectularius]
MSSEKLQKLDEDIARLDKIIRKTESFTNNEYDYPEMNKDQATGGTQTEKELSNPVKIGKVDKIIMENKKLREQINKLETTVAVLNSTAASKENNLHTVLKSQKELERALAKKVTELKHIITESEKYKDSAFGRIAFLEQTCEKLMRKITVQNDELAAVKEKYSQLKKKIFGTEKKNNKLKELHKNDEEETKTHDAKVKVNDKSTSKVEMVNKEVQVQGIFDDYCYDNIIANLFFLPSPPSSPVSSRCTWK